MMGEKYYYKVVREERGKYYSYIIDGVFELRYEIGKQTIPKIGKIFIFDTLKDAEKYVEGDSEAHKILKVRAKNVMGMVLRSNLGDRNIMRFWKDGSSVEANEFSVFFTPPGTMGADSITPIEVVKRR